MSVMSDLSVQQIEAEGRALDERFNRSLGRSSFFPSAQRAVPATKPARTKRDPHAEDPRIAAAVIRLVSLEHRTYSITSASNPGTTYLVKRIDGGWACTCPAGSHTRACYHVAAVMPRYRADLRRQTAMTNAWLADMVRPGLVPTQPVFEAEEPECCDLEPTLEPTRGVETHEGWEYKPAIPELMEAMGWA